MERPVAVQGGRLLTPSGELVHSTLLIEGEQITGLLSPGEGLPPWAEVIDAADCVVSPGFVDTHVHGGMGHNFMEGTPDSLLAISNHLVRGGTTACLATTTSAPLPAMVKALANIASSGHAPQSGQVEILGAHLEGPYINPSKGGSHAIADVRPASQAELGEIWRTAQEALKVVTLAPEIPGGTEAIGFLSQRGVQVSLGHSGASYAEARQALACGVRRATHLYSAMTPIHHREPGAVTALLEDQNVFLELTVDGRHVHPAVVAMTYRIAGPERILLITDGADIAGQGDGQFTRWEGSRVVVRDGECRNQAGLLAGSTLRLDQAVRNMVHLAGVPLSVALRMASETPARALGVARKGSLAVGNDGDVVVLDSNLIVVLSLTRGHIAYDGRQSGRTTVEREG